MFRQGTDQKIFTSEIKPNFSKQLKKSTIDIFFLFLVAQDKLCSKNFRNSKDFNRGLKYKLESISEESKFAQ